MTPGSSSNDVRYIFVYGTLLSSYKPDATHSPMSPPDALTSAGEKFSHAVLYDFKMFDVGAYPCVVPFKGALVLGELFQFEHENVLRTLDEYEGIGDDCSQPYEYRREVRRLRLSCDRISFSSIGC